ncbi:N-formylglutamate deformylase [Limimaricola pyoseonensis]|uniref:Formiminoglutamase n=1 Tax=Limimaricola pyoseonensis TaxID=521013 RepID=A0A1G7FUS9_9RHOB|nr:N-formylglutamate deformylase [Limimaricola pyoseonensis]SDE79631.1 formiminoglutamase [Limimaricola pyoseonensis]
MTPVEVIEGEGAVILGQPHGGTWLPDTVAARLNARGRALADTDWHIGRLYDELLPGATVVRANFHRYAIDANRDPGGGSLYPGQNTTGLCPATDFDGQPIWRPGAAPGAGAVAARRDELHAPYHAALAAQVERVRARHGVAVLWDCHSIRSEIPFLFEGRLPVLNIGSDGGATCDARIEARVAAACQGSGLETVLNGRFRGGWTTRHYGRPESGVHAIQMEIAQRAYLAAEAPPWAFDAERAAPLRTLLARILTDLDHLARSGALATGAHHA